MASTEFQNLKTTMTAEEFITICLGRGVNNIELSPYWDIKEMSLIIKDIEITDAVRFPEGSNSEYTLNIVNAEFKSYFHFNGSNFEDVYFDDCSFSFIHLFSGKLEDIEFKKCSIKSMYIHEMVYAEELSMEDCQCEHIRIWGGQFTELNIESCVVNLLNINGGKIKELYLISCVIQENQFSFAEIIEIGIESCIFGRLEFNNLPSTNIVELAESYVIDSLVLEDPKIKMFRIEGNEGDIFINKMNLTKNISSHIYIEEARINEIYFLHGIAEKDCVVQIHNCEFNGLYFRQFLNLGAIHYNNVIATSQHYAPSMPLVDRSKGEIEFSAIFKSSSIAIIDSSLGKTEIINSDFNTFDKFSFDSSNILSAFIAGSEMPSQISSIDEDRLHEQRRLGYGQLKKIYENRGDSVQAVHYYAQEMDSIYNELSWTNKFWEKFNVGLNSISSRHGSSWTRGVIFTAGVSLAFYWLYCVSLGMRFSFTYYGYTNLNKLAIHFFDFLNPIHKPGFLKDPLGLEDNLISILLDFLGRIFIGYGIYQTVQAFRKHGRR